MREEATPRERQGNENRPRSSPRHCRTLRGVRVDRATCLDRDTGARPPRQPTAFVLGHEVYGAGKAAEQSATNRRLDDRELQRMVADAVDKGVDFGHEALAQSLPLRFVPQCRRFSACMELFGTNHAGDSMRGAAAGVIYHIGKGTRCGSEGGLSGGAGRSARHGRGRRRTAASDRPPSVYAGWTGGRGRPRSSPDRRGRPRRRPPCRNGRSAPAAP